MHLPPAFEDRPPAVQIVLGIVVPVVFGAITGLVLGWSEIGYLILALLGIAGGYFAGLEHRGGEEGLVRGIVGGLLFGSFILFANELHGEEPKAHLPDPESGLVVITVVFGAVLGWLGGRAREKRERIEGVGPTTVSGTGPG
jgi:hypothetical protein